MESVDARGNSTTVPPMTTLRFGVNVPTSATPGADPVRLAQTAERLGFDFVSANDHPSGTRPTHEVWTMLTWIAAQTSRIGIATRVLGVPYRPPAVVAKMAATLDDLSGGRLVLGLGGGASDEQLRAFGFGEPTPREKVDRLAEAIEVLRGLWSQAPFTYEGRHYRVVAAELEPKPTRRIPIWLGTYGPRALDVTGRLADGWIPSYELAPPDQVVAMRERVHAAARAAGRDPGDVTCVYNLDLRVDEAATSTPATLTGPPGALAAQLAGFVRLGFTTMNLIPVGGGLDEQLERLAHEVLPEVRAAA